MSYGRRNAEAEREIAAFRGADPSHILRAAAQWTTGATIELLGPAHDLCDLRGTNDDL